MAAVWFCLGLFCGTMAGIFIVALLQVASKKRPYPAADDMVMESFPYRVSKTGDLAMDPSKDRLGAATRLKDESQPLCEQGA
jgi:hypothetical protein